MKKLITIFVLLSAAAAAQAPIDVTVGASVIHFKKLPKSTVTFGFSAGTVDAQGNATIAVSAATSRMPAAAYQFDILYPASVTAISATPGPVAIAAGKNISCSLVAAGDTRCLLSAVNQTTMANGVIANLAVTINATSTLTLSGVIASNLAAGGLATAITQATANVAIAVAIQGVQCVVPPYDSGLPANTYNLEAGESTTCTATLNQAAPAGGFTGTLSASSAGLMLPASVTIAAGQTSGQFTVTGQ